MALPNGLHYEWALRSIRAGKHVLLEKPCCSNAIEAKKLFNHPLVTAKNAPVLLEAFHYQFHPAFQAFLSEVRQSPGVIKHVYASFGLPPGVLGSDDIRFKYALAGGCMMDVGTYPLSIVRQILGREKTLEPVDVRYRGLRPGSDGNVDEPQVDQAIEAKYLTDDGVDVHISGDFITKGGWPSFLPTSWTRSLPAFRLPKSSVSFEPVLVDTPTDGNDNSVQHFVQRTLTLWNPLIPTFYHRIDISDEHTLRRGYQVMKRWNETSYKTAYNWPEGDKRAAVYKDWWTTYRCQLEEFVNRIKGREGSGVWVDRAESIAQMEAIDRTYEKAGLETRPTSTFELQ